MDIILQNWAELLLALIAFLDVVVSLTPTQKDDRFLGYLRTITLAFTKRTIRKAAKKQ
jgi:hypothetical protein